MTTTTYKFVSTNESDGDYIEVRTTANYLPKILENFENFLRAAGFSYKGHLEIVDDEVDTESEAP